MAMRLLLPLLAAPALALVGADDAPPPRRTVGEACGLLDGPLASSAALAPLLRAPAPFQPADALAYSGRFSHAQALGGLNGSAAVARVREGLAQVGASGVTTRDGMRAMHALYERAFCDAVRGDAARAAELARAVSLGLGWGPVGLDLRGLLARHAPNASAAAALLRTPLMRAVRDAFYPPAAPGAPLPADAAARAGAGGAVLEYCRALRFEPAPGRVIDAVWAADVRAQFASAAEADAALLRAGAEHLPRARALHSLLRAHGAAPVQRWPRLDLAALAAVATPLLDASAERARRAARTGDARAAKQARRELLFQRHLPPELGALLAPLLDEPALGAAVGAYLDPAGAADAAAAGAAPRVCARGVQLRRLDEHASLDTFVSAHWHHDRAGRRLRLFVFLHDVQPEGGRPTKVARGSHRTHWFSYAQHADARFDEAWVERHFEVVSLGGPAGGGFLLDTNALHKAELSGTVPRDTLIVELDVPGRCERLREVYTPPCTRPATGNAMPAPAGALLTRRAQCAAYLAPAEQGQGAASAARAAAVKQRRGQQRRQRERQR